MVLNEIAERLRRVEDDGDAGGQCAVAAADGDPEAGHGDDQGGECAEELDGVRHRWPSVLDLRLEVREAFPLALHPLLDADTTGVDLLEQLEARAVLRRVLEAQLGDQHRRDGGQAGGGYRGYGLSGHGGEPGRS